jgi:hypothetical protein
MLGYEDEARQLRQAGEVWSGMLRPDSHVVIGIGTKTLLLAGVETARELTGESWDGAGVLLDANRYLAEPAAGARILGPTDEYNLGQGMLDGPGYTFDHMRHAGMADEHIRVLTRHTGRVVAAVVQNVSSGYRTSVEVLPAPAAPADIPPHAYFRSDLESLAMWIRKRHSEIWKLRQQSEEQPDSAGSILRDKLIHTWYHAMPEATVETNEITQHAFNQQLVSRPTNHVRVGNWYYGRANDGIDFNYPVCRVYVNGRTAMLPALFDRLVHRLEDRDVDAQVKMAVHAKAARTRSDGLVAFFHPYDAEAVMEIISDDQLLPDAQLRPVIPRFTAPLHRANGKAIRGVAFAQSPVGMGSFGESRMHVMAEAILAGAQTVDELVVAWHAPSALHRSGINPVNPALSRYVRGLDAILERL